MEPLSDVVEYLMTLEAQVVGRVYPSRPVLPPELPCFWNWVRTGRFERRDTGTKKWTMGIDCVVAEAVSDPQESPVALYANADAFIAVADAALWNEPPGWINMAKLVDMTSGLEEFAGTFAHTLTFRTEVELAEPIR